MSWRAIPLRKIRALSPHDLASLESAGLRNAGDLISAFTSEASPKLATLGHRWACRSPAPLPSSPPY